jgi:hypothetical protein
VIVQLRDLNEGVKEIGHHIRTLWRRKRSHIGTLSSTIIFHDQGSHLIVQRAVVQLTTAKMLIVVVLLTTAEMVRTTTTLMILQLETFQFIVVQLIAAGIVLVLMTLQ